MGKSRMGIVIMAVLVAGVLFLNGYLAPEPFEIIRDSPAPGCIEYKGTPPIGGCFGKTIIENFKDPHIACLGFEINNCNGGVLLVRNSCNQTLNIGGVGVGPSTAESLDIEEKNNGTYLLKYSDGNFGHYVPENNETVRVQGKLGEIQLEISFTKTAKLC
ncbi:MAG: hypothetical protein HY366_02000 [Candidatus Aenigmarchaeota archaeon]|nr:hypothetical protein [Candidatus Aenigmarchaeota archaeon]